MPGVGTASFSGLMASTAYNTLIFPYTNSGSLIDYKNDGTPPAGSATTGEAAPSILFTTFDESWEDWTALSVAGDQIWDRDNTYGIDGTPCARMSGYSGEAFDNEDWLISPSVALAAINDQSLSFFSASAYTGPALEVLISTDYDGAGNPNDFTWVNLSDQAEWPVEGSFFEFTNSGQIDISSYAGQTIYVAFKFTSTSAGSATWEVDNIRIQGTGDGIYENQNPLAISIYPNPSTGIIYFEAKDAVKTIEVFTLTGIKVLQLNSDDFAGQIDLSKLENGIYMVRFAADEKISTRRIIIQ
jgi:hypothetical protein